MMQNAGIVREKTRLQNGLKRILELKNEFYSNKHNINLKGFKINDNNNSENCFNLAGEVITYCLRGHNKKCINATRE